MFDYKLLFRKLKYLDKIFKKLEDAQEENKSLRIYIKDQSNNLAMAREIFESNEEEWLGRYKRDTEFLFRLIDPGKKTVKIKVYDFEACEYAHNVYDFLEGSLGPYERGKG